MPMMLESFSGMQMPNGRGLYENKPLYLFNQIQKQMKKALSPVSALKFHPRHL